MQNDGQNTARTNDLNYSLDPDEKDQRSELRADELPEKTNPRNDNPEKNPPKTPLKYDSDSEDYTGQEAPKDSLQSDRKSDSTKNYKDPLDSKKNNPGQHQEAGASRLHEKDRDRIASKYGSEDSKMPGAIRESTVTDEDAKTPATNYRSNKSS